MSEVEGASKKIINGNVYKYYDDGTLKASGIFEKEELIRGKLYIYKEVYLLCPDDIEDFYYDLHGLNHKKITNIMGLTYPVVLYDKEEHYGQFKNGQLHGRGRITKYPSNPKWKGKMMMTQNGIFKDGEIVIKARVRDG